jgi:hypothetical protein
MFLHIFTYVSFSFSNFLVGAATKMDVGGNKMRSSSLEKKNRRKRAALELNPGKKPKRIKLEKDARLAYETYVAKKLVIKGPSTRVSCEP